MLLAFSTQSFITQTHIHPATYRTAVTFHTSTNASKHNNYPVNDDPNCPLCKEISYCGQFVAPQWAVFFLPLQAISLVETAIRPVSRSNTASQGWSSRAPPRS